jgi:hypothetical protein
MSKRIHFWWRFIHGRIVVWLFFTMLWELLQCFCNERKCSKCHSSISCQKIIEIPNLVNQQNFAMFLLLIKPFCGYPVKMHQTGGNRKASIIGRYHYWTKSITFWVLLPFSSFQLVSFPLLHVIWNLNFVAREDHKVDKLQKSFVFSNKLKSC